jgi:hypothetical protein
MIVPILLGVLSFAASFARADTLTSEYRIVGLFSPDRETDLRQVMEDIPELQLVSVDYENARVKLKYDCQTLFPELSSKKIPSAEKIEQRIDELLKKASDGTFHLNPAPVVSADKLKKLEIPVGILDCKGCRYGVYLLAMKLPGVERATVVGGDHAVATVWIDTSKTTPQTVEESLAKATKKAQQ